MASFARATIPICPPPLRLSRLQYFKGPHFAGIGSSHTAQGAVWPMALMVQALTSGDAGERAHLLRALLKLQCGNGLMHESVRVDNLQDCTRTSFGWANAL